MTSFGIPILDKTFQCKGFYLKTYTCDFRFHHKNLEVYVEYENAKHFMHCTFQNNPINCIVNTYDYEDLLAPENIQAFNFRIFDKKTNLTYCREIQHYKTVRLPVFRFKEIAKTDRDLQFQLHYEENAKNLNLIDYIPYNVSYSCKDELCERKTLTTKTLLFTLSNLPYAYFSYEIHLWISIENCTNVTEQVLNIATTSRTPDLVPVFKDYYFNIQNKQITLYWKSLERQFYNGPLFNYKLFVLKENKILRTIFEGGNQAHLDLDPYDNYTFSLQSCNEKGCSENKTSIYYHQKETNYKMYVWTMFEQNNYRLYWYAENEKEPPLNLIVAFYDHDSTKVIHFIEGINTTTNSLEFASSKDPSFGVVANYRNFTTGIVWNYCKSDSKSGLKAPEIVIFERSSTELKILFQNFYCIYKAAADFYEITYCNEESCSERNATNKDLTNDEFVLDGLEPFTVYNVSARIYNKFLGYGRSSDFVICKTGEAVSSAPLNLTVMNKTSSTLTLSWSPPEVIQGDVQYYLLNFQNSKSSITIPANMTSYIVRSLECSTTYSFYITLKTKFFESLPSYVVQGTTSVTAPSKPELNEINYDGNHVILGWQRSECLAPSNGFYILSIGGRQSILSGEKCTLTQPICEKNVSAIVKLFVVNRVLRNESDENCKVLGDFDNLCEEHKYDLILGPQEFLCSEELVTELKCSSFKYLTLLYVGLPVCFILLSIVCVIVVRKVLSMRDIKCIPPKGLIELSDNRNEEMYNLMNVNH
ncbi:DOME.2 family protein [Megaselia abdita]